MKLKDNMQFSTLILTGTIIPEKMDMIYGILQNNAKIIGRFRNVVSNLNCINNDGWKYVHQYEELVMDLVGHYDTGQVHRLRDYINRGWQFGTMDIERTAYDFCIRNLSQDFILKMDFDMYLEEKILDIDISDADAMIMPSIGYATTHEEYKGDFDKMMELYDRIPPQSTIYLIFKPMDYLYADADWVNTKYKQWVLNPVGNGPHYIGVACEPLLRQSFERNNFRIKPMISKKSFRNLLELIETKRIVDPSHKNLFFDEVGVCHLVDDGQEIIKI